MEISLHLPAIMMYKFNFIYKQDTGLDVGFVKVMYCVICLFSDKSQVLIAYSLCTTVLCTHSKENMRDYVYFTSFDTVQSTNAVINH